MRTSELLCNRVAFTEVPALLMALQQQLRRRPFGHCGIAQVLVAMLTPGLDAAPVAMGLASERGARSAPRMNLS